MHAKADIPGGWRSVNILCPAKSRANPPGEIRGAQLGIQFPHDPLELPKNLFRTGRTTDPVDYPGVHPKPPGFSFRGYGHRRDDPVARLVTLLTRSPPAQATGRAAAVAPGNPPPRPNAVAASPSHPAPRPPMLLVAVVDEHLVMRSRRQIEQHAMLLRHLSMRRLHPRKHVPRWFSPRRPRVSGRGSWSNPRSVANAARSPKSPAAPTPPAHPAAGQERASVSRNFEIAAQVAQKDLR